MFSYTEKSNVKAGKIIDEKAVKVIAEKTVAHDVVIKLINAVRAAAVFAPKNDLELTVSKKITNFVIVAGEWTHGEVTYTIAKPVDGDWLAKSAIMPLWMEFLKVEGAKAPAKTAKKELGL